MLLPPVCGTQHVANNTPTGVDDVLALLLALSAQPDELEVAMISVTYGNVPLQRCVIREDVPIFHHISYAHTYLAAVYETSLHYSMCWKRRTAGAKPLERTRVSGR